MQKNITWHGKEFGSIERCEISTSDAGIEVRGSIEGTADDGSEFEIKYSLELSPGWEVQHVVVRDVKNEGNELDLQRENDQWFDVDGLHLEELDDADYVDLTLTPFTNTLPIKRLQLESGGEPQRISVVYIELPEFDVRKVEQLYSRIGKNTYRYEDIETPGFNADLVVDDDGLVLVYPGLFHSAVE